MGLLFLWVGFALVVSHLCSLLETTLFSVRASALLIRKASGSEGASRLLAIKQHRIDEAIGAILILNTLASVLGSSLAGAQAATVFGQANVGYLSAALTVGLLIVSEILPKTLAARYAGSLSGFVGYTLSYLIPLLRPILFLTGALIRLIARRPGERLTRREFAMLVGSARDEGTISHAESTLIGSLIYSRDIAVSDIMTPAAAIFSMDAHGTLADLVASEGAVAFSRIPLYRGDSADIIGYFSHRDALRAAATGAAPQTTLLEAFNCPIPRLVETTQVGRAVELILDQREAIAVVTSGSGGVVGLVTLEDLFEAILGMEITDEAETISGLRPAVAAARKHRLSKLRDRRAKEHPATQVQSDLHADPSDRQA